MGETLKRYVCYMRKGGIWTSALRNMCVAAYEP